MPGGRGLAPPGPSPANRLWQSATARAEKSYRRHIPRRAATTRLACLQKKRMIAFNRKLEGDDMRMLFVVVDKKMNKNLMPMGEAYLASYLRQFGHEIEIYCQDVYHFSEQHLFEYLEKTDFDIVGMGFISSYFRKALKISEAVNKLSKRPFFVLGAHGPTATPAYMLRRMGADAVVMGEAELILKDLLETLAGNGDLGSVKGIVFRQDDEIVTTPARELFRDLDSLPFPAWDLLPMGHYIAAQWPPAGGSDRSASVFASRGCPYKCNFCFRIDPRWRARSIPNVLAEVEALIDRYYVNYFHFDDELFAPGRKRMLEFCKAILDRGLRIKWDCQGHFKSLDREVIEAMKEAGCEFINVGVESYDQSVLDAMHKGTTREEIRAGLSLMKEFGIHAGLNVLWGNLKDSAHSLKETLNLVREFDSNFQCRTFRPPSPYPGSPLFHYAVRNGMLKDEHDFYERYQGYDRVTVNFTDIPEDDFYRMLFDANNTLVNAFFEAKKKQILDGLSSAYFGGATDFRLLSLQEQL